ncbi:hypothetical protein L083_2259 [Actinoplanes sp. N902-109]|nr:hypothetical protein L083_2259 [Actinoplanes sp. N902-109]
MGPRRLEHPEANLSASDITLTPAQHDQPDQVSAPQLNHPVGRNRPTGAMPPFPGHRRRPPLDRSSAAHG